MGAPSYNPVEIGAAPIIIETFFQSVTCIQRFWELSRGRYSRLTLMSSNKLAEHGDVVGMLKCDNGLSNMT